jgi:5-methylcytosine-specific restriction endonuclease McrA
MKKKPRRLLKKNILKSLQKKAEALWKDYCRKRDTSCRLCDGSNILQVHHIFSRKSKGLFLDVENGVLLCRDCHCSVTFNDSVKDKLRRKINPVVYDRLYEQSQDMGPFLEWKQIPWLERQIAVLEELVETYSPQNGTS